MFNPIADFMAMRRQIEARSRLIGLWGFMLNVPILLGGLVFINRPAGWVTAAAIVVSLLIAIQINKRAPMSRLMGLCHVVFLPAIFILAGEFDADALNSPYNLWVAYSLALMSLCVLIDLFDLYRYFVLGNRTYGSPVA